MQVPQISISELLGTPNFDDADMDWTDLAEEVEGETFPYIYTMIEGYSLETGWKYPMILFSLPDCTIDLNNLRSRITAEFSPAFDYGGIDVINQGDNTPAVRLYCNELQEEQHWEGSFVIKFDNKPIYVTNQIRWDIVLN